MLCAVASILLSVARQRCCKKKERKYAEREASHLNGVAAETALNCLVSHYKLFSQRRPACPGGSFGFPSVFSSAFT